MKRISFHIFDGRKERTDVIAILDENTIVVYEESKQRIRQEEVKEIRIVSMVTSGFPRISQSIFSPSNQLSNG